MDENNKFDVVGTNIAEKATMIWNVADTVYAKERRKSTSNNDNAFSFIGISGRT